MQKTVMEEKTGPTTCREGGKLFSEAAEEPGSANCLQGRGQAALDMGRVDREAHSVSGGNLPA